MCGKDGAQRGVYKQKEEHEKGIGTKIKKEKRTDIRKEGERKSRKKSVALVTKKEIHYINFKPLTFLKVNFWEGRPKLT